MGSKFLSLLFLVLSTALVVNCVDQCDNNLPVEVEFYFGSAPIDDIFAGKEVGELIGSLTQGLATIFHAIQQNATINLEEMLNGTVLNVTEEGNSASIGALPPMQFDPKPPTSPLGDLGKKLAVPDFLKNVVHDKSHSSNETHPQKFDLSSLGVNFGMKPIGPIENTTIIEGENPILSTWGLTLPLNTIKAELAKIHGDRLVEVSKLDSTFFSSNKTVKNINKFIQYVDLTEFNLAANEWFVVCVTMSTVKNDKQGSCQRCFLLRVCESTDLMCAQKFITLRAPDSKVHPNSANLQYLVLQLPLADIKLLTKVTAKPVDARCEGNNATNPADKSSKLFSNTVLYVNIPNLSPKTSYNVEANLIVELTGKYKSPFGWSNPIVIPDYLDAKEDFIIYACGQNPNVKTVGFV